MHYVSALGMSFRRIKHTLGYMEPTSPCERERVSDGKRQGIPFLLLMHFRDSCKVEALDLWAVRV